jgi:mannose-6-phosphate isomerase-like protein (cupin superfamily)
MAAPDVTFATLDLDTGERFQRLRRELGVESFGLNLMILRPGQRGRVHIHERQEEVYLVLEGALTLIVEGEERVLERGQLARVPPRVRRQVANTGSERLAMIALGGSGEHESRDALAWGSWEDQGPGRSPADVPLPEDLPAA